MVTSGLSKNCCSIHLGEAFDAHEERLSRLTARTLGFLPVDLVEHGLQGLFQCLVLSALVELAHEVAADFERVEAEL